MPAPYSNDLRLKVIDAFHKGDETIETIAQRFSVSGSFVKNLMKRYRRTGQVAPARCSGFYHMLACAGRLTAGRLVASSLLLLFHGRTYMHIQLNCRRAAQRLNSMTR